MKKKSGELRPVIDYRGLNSVTVKNRYPLPLINEMLYRFANARIFSKIDLRGAYNLVRIKEGDEWKTAFRCRFGHFEYRVMPFGLTNAPAVFQNLMNEILHDYLDVFCVVYLDDILIYSQNPTDHTDHVRWVLTRLKENMLFAKFEKCVFSVHKVEFLGYIISDLGIEMDPKRISSIESWPTPVNIKTLQSFLGFANFYRMFIPNYSTTIVPLLTLLKKNQPFNWTNVCAEAFQNLKNIFKSANILNHPDSSKAFVVEADASDFAIGGVLSQEYDGMLRPVAYYSRKLSSPEINYEVHDKELLAIVACFYQWRPFLLSNTEPIQVITDHQNLLHFSTSKKLNRRQVRWSLFLTNFNFQITFWPGVQGGKPDALSQRIDYQLQPTDPQVKDQEQILLSKDKFVLGTTQVQAKLVLLDRIKLAQAEDGSINKHYDNKNFQVTDDCLLYRNRIVIPESMKMEILQACHDLPFAGHPGVRKTFELISRTYWWSTSCRDCKSYVESCELCARAKPERKKPAGLLNPLPIPPRPWHSISMDLITDLPVVGGVNSILVIVDRFTKMSHFIACNKTINSFKLADLFFDQIVRLHGFPRDIVSDRGSIFVSQFWSSLLKNYGISQSLSSAYHPQTDGQTERVNQELEQYLRIYADQQQQNWLKNLSMAELCYNSRFHSAIQMSPFCANYGYEPVFDGSTELLPESPPTVQVYVTTLQDNIGIIKEELKIASESSKYFADKKRRHEEFKVGDLVYLSKQNIKTTRPCAKLDWKCLGPFRIIKKINPVLYQLKLPLSMKRIHDVFHISLLSRYKTSNLPGRLHYSPPPIHIDETGDFYEVKDILDVKKVNGIYHFLISWKGYSDSDNSWEPEENLVNCRELVNNFKHRFKNCMETTARGAHVRN